MDSKEIIQKVQTQSAVLLYFYKNSCSACQVLKPKIGDLISEKYPNIEVIYVDSSDHTELSASMYVFSNPTMILFFEGKESKRFNQFVSVSELTKYLNKMYNLLYE
ncbi:MAG: thiol reductase thioredoxin [Bacteroidetes bacterium]|nr:thiol reductase thioredoxin [Bacteroidota bacterium]|tara:strand:- start:472 stop:789 length:318 start_codon:yes stop_codon:yes gene_type:complete